MYNRKFFTLSLSALGVVTLIAAISLFSFHSPRAAAQTSSPLTARAAVMSGESSIVVVGEGTMRIKPDIAQAVIGVEVSGSTVKDASAEAQQLMEDVLAALLDAGIAENDIQTSGFNIFADRSYGPEGPSANVIYRVNNSVSVTIRALETVGSVLDAAIEAGANNIFGVNFRLSTPSEVESEARAKAIADANSKAAELAELSGMQLGPIVAISEIVGGAGGGYYSNNFRNMASAGMGGGGPIAPGELELSLQLQVTYVAQ